MILAVDETCLGRGERANSPRELMNGLPVLVRMHGP
jgi:hypothetical protein